MECVEVDVERRNARFNGDQMLEPVDQAPRRRDDGDLGELIAGLERLHAFEECFLEAAERPVRNAEHELFYHSPKCLEVCGKPEPSQWVRAGPSGSGPDSSTSGSFPLPTRALRVEATPPPPPQARVATKPPGASLNLH